MPAKKTTSTKTKSPKKKVAKKTSPKSQSTKTKSSKSKSTATKKKASPKKRAASKSTKTKAGDQEVTIDRRRQAGRRDGDTDQANPTQAPKLERREKVQRRRQIDPTTCERDYSDAEVEFMNAMDEYKRTSGRMFPTCSEVLEVIRNLGYVQLTSAELAIVRPETPEVADSATALEENLDEENFDNAELETTEAF